jgi:Transglutaminase-like superfamily
MSEPVALPPRVRLPLGSRVLALLAVGLARSLERATPARIQRVLRFVRRGAKPASPAQAEAARNAVISVSLRCGGKYCLQRSIAAALLCRARGTWPTWCSGVRTNPFAAHAWIEAGNRPIGELFPAGYYQKLITIAPPSPTRAVAADQRAAVSGDREGLPTVVRQLGENRGGEQLGAGDVQRADEVVPGHVGE